MTGIANSIVLSLSRVSARFLLIVLLMPAFMVDAQQLIFPGDQETGASTQTHIVKKGDTLYELAQTYKTSTTEIKKLNGMGNTTIFPGQVLIVKNQVSKTATARTASGVIRSSQTVAKATTKTPAVSSLDDFAREITDGYVGPSSLIAAELQILEETPTVPEERPINAVLATVSRPDGTNNAGNTRGGTDFRDTQSSYRGTAQPIRGQVAEKTTSEWYRVQDGDDIYSIADTYEVRPEELAAWNQGIRDVRPGDVLQIKKSAAPTATQRYRTQAVDTVRYSFRSELPSQTSRQLSAAERAAATYRGNARGNSNLSTASTEYIESRGLSSAAAPQLETGVYSRFEYLSLEKIRFYGIHKTLPAGAKVKMGIPNNPGYIEVLIVGQLDAQSNAIIGLSPACLQILEGAGKPAKVTIAYE